MKKAKVNPDAQQLLVAQNGSLSSSLSVTTVTEFWVTVQKKGNASNCRLLLTHQESRVPHPNRSHVRVDSLVLMQQGNTTHAC